MAHHGMYQVTEEWFDLLLIHEHCVVLERLWENGVHHCDEVGLGLEWGHIESDEG